MSHLRISQAAQLLGLSDDTLRRAIEAGRITSTTDASGRAVVDAEDVARLMREQAPADPAAGAPVVAQSARNRFAGVVTRVVKDGVMAQVEIQAGPHRVVSLMSREAAEELGLAPGVRAVASVKSTNVVVEIPDPRP